LLLEIFGADLSIAAMDEDFHSLLVEDQVDNELFALCVDNDLSRDLPSLAEGLQGIDCVPTSNKTSIPAAHASTAIDDQAPTKTTKSRPGRNEYFRQYHANRKKRSIELEKSIQHTASQIEAVKEENQALGQKAVVLEKIVDIRQDLLDTLVAAVGTSTTNNNHQQNKFAAKNSLPVMASILHSQKRQNNSAIEAREEVKLRQLVSTMTVESMRESRAVLVQHQNDLLQEVKSYFHFQYCHRASAAMHCFNLFFAQTYGLTCVCVHAVGKTARKDCRDRKCDCNRTRVQHENYTVDRRNEIRLGAGTI
jgi:hypothetical protein